MWGRKRSVEAVHFTVEVEDIDHILVPPEQDPFSENPTRYMGHSGLQRSKAMVREERGWDRRRYKLTFLVPKDQLARRSEGEIRAAIRRYCETLRRDNEVQLQVIRHRGMRQLPFAFVILFSCITAGVVIGSDAVVDASPLLATAVSEGLFIIGWVALWGPTDTLLFEPMELRTENKLLALLEGTELEIRESPSRP